MIPRTFMVDVPALPDAHVGHLDPGDEERILKEFGDGI